MTSEEFNDKAVRLSWHTLEFAGFLWNEDMLKSAVKQCVEYPFSTPEDVYNKVAGGIIPFDAKPFHELKPVGRVPYGLVVAIVDVLRAALLERDPGSCKRIASVQRVTQYHCGLSPGHEGPCVPPGALPLEVVRPGAARKGGA